MGAFLIVLTLIGSIICFADLICHGLMPSAGRWFVSPCVAFTYLNYLLYPVFWAGLLTFAFLGRRRKGRLVVALLLGVGFVAVEAGKVKTHRNRFLAWIKQDVENKYWRYRVRADADPFFAADVASCIGCRARLRNIKNGYQLKGRTESDIEALIGGKPTRRLTFRRPRAKQLAGTRFVFDRRVEYREEWLDSKLVHSRSKLHLFYLNGVLACHYFHSRKSGSRRYSVSHDCRRPRPHKNRVQANEQPSYDRDYFDWCAQRNEALRRRRCRY